MIIVQPSTIYDTYKGLVQDYYSELIMDMEEMKGQWFEQYYLSTYEKLCDKCEEFLNGDFKLNIPFENACVLYNNWSERDFNKFLKTEENLTNEIAKFRVNYISLMLDKIINKIFKEESSKKVTR